MSVCVSVCMGQQFGDALSEEIMHEFNKTLDSVRSSYGLVLTGFRVNNLTGVAAIQNS